MKGCSGSCASTTPSSGQGFILRGGDTWTSSDLGGVNWTWSGTSTAPIYIGVDPNWPTGGAWSRPIWTCSNTNCGDNSATYGNVVWLAGNYTVFDNIELTGYQYDGGGHEIGVYGDHITVSNCYIHGFSRTSGATSSNPYAISMYWSNYAGEGAGDVFTQNVIDGSDSPNQDFMGGILHGDTVKNNVIRYVYNGMNGIFNTVAGNLVEDNYVAASGDHCNMVFFQGLFTATTGYVYNNVIRHSGCSGGSTLWLLGNANCTSCAMYAYNNVIYDTAGDFDPVNIPLGNHPGNSGGPFYLYNNTLEAGGSDSIGNGESPPRFTAYYSNNHFINVASACLATGITCTNNGTNLTETSAQATTAGYTSSETDAYSSTSGSSPTVGKGTNYTSMCSGSLAAICNDTTYPEYNSLSHTVTLSTTNPRGTSWDIGAYQYSGGGPVQPPTGAQATGH